MGRQREIGRRAVLASACAAALLLAGCTDNPFLRIVNRTQAVLLVTVWQSEVVVGACSERALSLEGGSVGGDNAGRPPHEAAPDGALRVSIPVKSVAVPMDAGLPTQTIVITQDYIGVTKGIDPYTPIPVAGGGSFPADPGSVACAGSPPPQPSPSP